MAPAPPGRGRPVLSQEQQRSTDQHQGNATPPPPHSLANDFTEFFNEHALPSFNNIMEKFVQKTDAIFLEKISKINKEEDKIAVEWERLKKEQSQLQLDKANLQVQRDLVNVGVQQLKEREKKVDKCEAQMKELQIKHDKQQAELEQARKKVKEVTEKNIIEVQRVAALEAKLSQQKTENLELQRELEGKTKQNHEINELIESLEKIVTQRDILISNLRKEMDDMKSKVQQKDDWISHMEKEWEKKEKNLIEERDAILVRQAEKEKALLTARKTEWIPMEDFISSRMTEAVHMDEKFHVSKLAKVAKVFGSGSQSKVYFKMDDMKELALGLQLPSSAIISDVAKSTGRDIMSSIEQLNDDLLRMLRTDNPVSVGTMSVCSFMRD